MSLNLNILVRMDEIWPWRKPLTLYLQYLTEGKLVLGKYFANMSILAILPDVDSAESNGLTLVNKWSPPTSEVDGADCPRAAGRGVARVGLLHAALRLADEAAGAVGVADTLGLAARDSVWK